MRRGSVLALAASAAAICGILTAGPASAGPAGAAGLAASAGAGGPGAKGPAHASPVAEAPAWGLARQLPGLETLARGKSVLPQALSCSGAGDCAVGGAYADASGATQAFVAVGRGGTWAAASGVPGLAALNRGGSAIVTSVSCPDPGDCVAGGRYSPGGTNGGGREPSAEAFVVAEHGGVWGPAVPLRGLAALNKGNSAGVSAVSCWSAGDCSVAGTYAAAVRGRDLDTQAFVASEHGGAWGPAVPLPHLAALNTGGEAEISALSCAPAPAGSGGDCVVGGEYGGRAGEGAYVARETRGAWRAAGVFPGTADAARVNSISCPSAGDCAASGTYTYRAGHGTRAASGFVADSRAGRWGAPHRIPGADAVVSCGSPGNCAAGGTYAPRGTSDAFVVTEARGRWGGPRPVPGLAGLNTGRDAGIVAVSCAPGGTCGVGGSYASPRSGAADHAFVATAAGGTWSGARPAGAGTGDSAVTLISCVSPVSCTAAGFDNSGDGIFVQSTAPRP